MSELLEHPTCAMQVMQGLRQIIGAANAHAEKLKPRYKVTGSQLICLGIIQTNGPSMPLDIARQSYLSTGSVLDILELLENQAYVHWNREGKDREYELVSLTHKAVNLLNLVPSSINAGLYNAIRQLPEEEQHRIAVSIKNIIHLIGTASQGFANTGYDSPQARLEMKN